MKAPVGRLKQRSDFLRVAAARRKCVTPGLILQASPSEAAARTPGGLRVGFTVSRKVGKAVARNRAKRRLRAAAGEVMPASAAPGYDYVLIGRRGTLTRPFRALAGDLEKALRRLGTFGAAGADVRERR